MAQFDGLRDGFRLYATSDEQAATLQYLYLLNSVGDLETLNGLFDATAARRKRRRNVSESDVGASPGWPGGGRRHEAPGNEYPTDRLDCSALIVLVGSQARGNGTAAAATPRVGGGGMMMPATVATDVYAGHATWRSYYAMLRIYKALLLLSRARLSLTCAHTHT